MKNKKMVCGTILLLFAMSGICNIISVSAEEFYLIPLGYVSWGLDVEHNDKIDIYVDSSGTVDVYIMLEWQYKESVDSGGMYWKHLKRWQDTTHVGYIFDFGDMFPEGLVYIVVYNKDIFFGRTIDFDVKRIPYFDITPIIVLIIGISVVVAGIVLPILLKKRSKRKKREAGTIQNQENAKSFYCPKCGYTNIDSTSEYCSNCGSKIKR